VTVGGGGVQIVSGGFSHDTVINYGGTQTIASGSAVQVYLDQAGSSSSRPADRSPAP